MLRLLADEHIDHRLISAVTRRNPAVEFIRLQDVGLRTAADSAILAWAADHGFIVVSRDRATMKDEAQARMARHESMPGVILAHQQIPIGRAAEHLLTYAVAGEEGDLEGQVIYLPFT